MRTTLTLDDDVASALSNEIRKHPGKSMKEVANELLRAGLYVHKQAKEAPRFKVEPFSLGIKPEINYDNISELLDEIEGPSHR
jgi:hypothetical protein